MDGSAFSVNGEDEPLVEMAHSDLVTFVADVEKMRYLSDVDSFPFPHKTPLPGDPDGIRQRVEDDRHRRRTATSLVATALSETQGYSRGRIEEASARRPGLPPFPERDQTSNGSRATASISADANPGSVASSTWIARLVRATASAATAGSIAIASDPSSDAFPT